MSKKINFRLVISIFGFLLIVETCFMLVSLIPSAIYQEGDFAAILISSFITFFCGSILWLQYKRKEEVSLGKREGYIVASFSWIIFSVFGSLPFLLSGSVNSFTDAFFETMSGVTTTGSSIYTDIEVVTKGILFWRSIIQWVGGFGIIVLSLAILPLLSIGGGALYVAEVQGLTKDKIHHRIRETAKRLGMVYLILTAVEVVLLVIGKMDLFDAICHAFTTIATGGFSTKNSSFAAYSPYIQYVVVVFMMLAGINFTLHYYALSGKLRKFWGDEELRFYVIFIFITSLIIAVLLFLNHFSGVEKSIRNALFQVTSIITTTGFVSSDYLIWPGMMWFFVFLLFFAGACSGSTAGSIKMIRHIFLFKNFSLELKRLLHPNAVLPVQYNGKPVPKDSFLNVQVFFLFYMVIFALGSLIMSTTGLDFKSALGAVASSLGNIGPGLGTVGPMGNFAHVSIFGKWFLSFMMLLGRLELFTVMILLSPAFWRK